MERDRVGDWILTFSGIPFWPLDPIPSEISIVDIAHALSNVCRFTGHVREFYSVGQHAVLVSHAVPPEDGLWGLLHDASEAYVADVASPVKRDPAMAPYRAIEDRLLAVIATRFRLVGSAPPPSVKEADLRMLVTEARDLMPFHPMWGATAEPYVDTIYPWSPKHAREEFLRRFEELRGHQHAHEALRKTAQLRRP